MSKDPDEICPTSKYWLAVKYDNLIHLINLPRNITGLEANTEYNLKFSISNQGNILEQVYKTTPGRKYILKTILYPRTLLFKKRLIQHHFLEY